jgi:hypothetical protein
MRGLLWLVPVFLLTGCMHLSTISTETPPADIEEANRIVAGRTGWVERQSGETVWGRHFQIGNDVTMWRPLRSESMTVMPNAQIRHLTVPDRRKGLIEGLTYGPVVGAFIGAGLGILAYAAQGSEPVNNAAPPDSGHWGCSGTRANPRFSAGALVGFGALGGAVVGAGIGILFGIGEGSMMRIQFVPPYANRE